MTPLAFRFAWRELRGGLRGFGIFIACIALGVMAIAGVGAVAQSLADGLARQAASFSAAIWRSRWCNVRPTRANGLF